METEITLGPVNVEACVAQASDKAALVDDIVEFDSVWPFRRVFLTAPGFHGRGKMGVSIIAKLSELVTSLSTHAEIRSFYNTIAD